MKPTIRPYNSPVKPHLKFVVSHRSTDGKRVRRFFKTKSAAQIHAAQIQSLSERAGHEAASLEGAELREVLELRRRCQAAGLTLAEAVERSIEEKERETSLHGMAFEKAVDLFIADMEQRRSRPRTISNLQSALRNFSEGRSRQSVNAFTEADCKAWIYKNGTARTHVNRRAWLLAFFNWASTYRPDPETAPEVVLCPRNPLAHIKRPKPPEQEPKIYTLAEARRLMAAANELQDGKWVPYMALALFCGLRPDAELSRLTWDDLDLDKRIVKIRGEASKLYGRRNVPISENCLQWLLPFAAARPPIMAPNLPKDRKTLAKNAKVTWIQDGTRHTALSAFITLDGIEKASKYAGNSPDILKKKYDGIMEEKTAKALFKITPDQKKTLKFERKSA